MEAVWLIGIPASGKSSFYAATFAATHLRINLDMLRTRHREGELIATCLRLQQPFVIDDTNASRVERARFLGPARAAGFRTVGYYFASKIAECLPRNAARTGAARIPDEGVLATASRLELPSRDEGFDALHYVRFLDGAFVVEEWRDEGVARSGDRRRSCPGSRDERYDDRRRTKLEVTMRSELGSIGVVLLGLGVAASSLVAQGPPSLRLVPLLDGLRSDVPDGDFARLVDTTIAHEANKVGIDLAQPKHPLVVAAFEKRRLFYVFYKATEEAFGERPWVLQRIRKVERTWKKPDAPPDEKVTWQVEAFKTQAGSLKSADQHFGSFALRDAHRREVVKEYEIGFGEIPGHAVGTTWPFAANTLFHMLQPYGDEPGLFEKVAFTNARRWTLTTSFGKDGTWSLVCPELGIDLPKKAPAAAAARPEPDAASKAIVLKIGEGVGAARLGTSTIEEVGKVLGEALEDVVMPGGGRNVSYRAGLTCNFDATGKLNTILTRSTFAGRTSNAITHGASRADVKKKLGAPKDGADDVPAWTYPGLVVTFDAFGEVTRLVVTK